MKNLLFLPIMLLCMLVASCSNDIKDTLTPTTAKVSVLFEVEDYGITRAASVGTDKFPTTESKSNAETVVKAIYTTPKSQGLSFFVDNYGVKLENDQATAAITAWDGSTTLSLTEKNTIKVTLTENEEGAFPKFKVAEGWVDLSSLDLDSSSPSFSSANYGGDIEINSISVDTNGKVSVTIKVKLTYDSYLLVAPSSYFSVLTNVKGFVSMTFDGKAFKTTETLGTDKKWFYYWGSGNKYVSGSGSILKYGFNLYSDGSDDIKVVNGYWYAMFASLSSIGEGADDATTQTHIVGGSNGIEPTANDIVMGGAIR